MLRESCPAKINWSLRVLGVREDGYHELDTVFQTVDLCDTLEVAPARELSLTCDEPRLPVDSSNLVLRAALSLAERFDLGGAGARFTLTKRIPLQGGLGGGSSDAASALRLCSRLWGLDLGRAELLPIARQLGADVPFFLFGARARGRGRGDRIEPLPPARSRAIVLGCPPYGVPTAEVFARLRRRLEGSHPLAPARLHEELVNDLEPVVFEGWPELGRFRESLVEVGAREARLSGSGSTVYGSFDDTRAAAAAIEALRPRYAGWRLLPARTLDEPAPERA